MNDIIHYNFDDGGKDQPSGVIVPDLTNYVIGIRSWSGYAGMNDPYNKKDPYVLSSYQGVWTPGINEAICNYHARHGVQDISPVDGCSCGLYAYHDISRFDTNGIYGPIWGSIVAWGKLRVTKDGFRAQYAQITGICPGPDFIKTDIEDLVAVAKAFNVELVKFHEIDEHARRFGHPVPADMIPARTPKVAPVVKRSLPLASPLPMSGDVEYVQKGESRGVDLMVALLLLWALIIVLIVLFE